MDYENDKPYDDDSTTMLSEVQGHARPCNGTPLDNQTYPRDVIADIRRFEFGIGASLEGDGRIVVDNMVRRYRNLLATIAEDLNSKESHFILELVQNADDNHYKVGVAPSLSFMLEGNRLVVVNNEVGFTDENVKALCSAGESSKKNKSGYIGEKGIGFKSVFKVTDAPEIHSNGYHFQFNRSDPQDLLGYVVPHWKEATLQLDDSVTTVVLPAKPGRRFAPEMLSDLNATLLLFLDKLRQLEVRSGNDVVRYSRGDAGAITTLTTTHLSSGSDDEVTRSVYLRTKTLLDMSDITEPKRERVLTSDLVLAFPLSESGEAAPMPACPTYAFLPIREFGFTFCIQGDFVLISSREGIHEDLPWNIRLRDAIAPAFVAALEQFKTSPALANSYLRFLPAEEEVLDPFFKPVVRQIVEALKEVESVPVESGGWRKPAQVLLASAAIHALFTSDDVLALFGADYPSSKFVGPKGGLQRLECRTLLISDVMDVFGKHSEWFATKGLAWKAGFYAYLAMSPNRQDFIKSMMTLPCLPTTDGRLVSPNAGVVFYPLSANQQYGFEHELTILDGELYEMALAISPEVKSLFDSLNVRHDNPLELVRSHILKRHTSEGIADADQGALLGHIRYIKDKLDRYLILAAPSQTEASTLQELRDGLFLGTKHNEENIWVFNRPSELYLSKDYRPAFNIEGLLAQNIAPGLLLSEQYIVKQRGEFTGDETAADLERWRQFFIRIGVNESPKVMELGDGDTKCSDELAALLQSEDQPTRRLTLECLDRNWSAYDSHTSYQVKTGRYSTAEHLTQFTKQLRTTKTPTKRRTVVPLDQAYHDVGEVKSILGGNVTFVDATIHDERFFKACGITYKVDAQGCLKRLRQIRAEGGGTRDQIRAIYRRFESLWSTERQTIEQAFASEALISIRSGENASWVSPSDTCWRPTNLKFLDARHPPLQSQYHDHSTFFTKLLSVPVELPLDKWVDGLQALPTLEDGQERAEVALAIYRRLSRELGQLARSRQTAAPAWLTRFQRQALFLDHRGTLVRNSTSLFYNDSPDHAVLFADVPSISLLAVPKEQLSAVANLLNSVGVRSLSNALKVEVAAGIDGNVNEALTQKVQEMFGCIARVVYGQSHERFETALKENLFDDLRKLQVREVSDLKLEVSLGEVMRRTGGDMARRGNELLLRADAPSHVDYVAMEVRKLLRLPPELSDTISRLLISPTVRDAEAFLAVRNFSDLPPQEATALEGLPAEPPAEEQPSIVTGDPLVKPTDSPADFAGESEAKPAPTQTGEAPWNPPSPSLTGQPTSAGVTGTTQKPGPRPTNGAIGRHLGPAPQVPSTAERHDSALHNSAKSSGTDGSLEGSPPAAPSQPTSPGGGTFMPRSGTFDSLGAGSRRGKRPSNARSKRTKKGRLLSYAEPNGAAEAQHGLESESDSELTKHNSIVEQAAVKHFIETAGAQWKSLEEMPHENPGFDLKAVALNGTEEVIEVKGQSGAWTEEGVALTPTELVKAHNMRSRYWLCVVEYATDENRRQLWLVRDPFGLTNQFRFDKGWKAMAVTIATKPQRPEPGMFVYVPGEGKGRILKVKGSAQFAKLHIDFEDGRQVFSKVFNPATMILSFD